MHPKSSDELHVVIGVSLQKRPDLKQVLRSHGLAKIQARGFSLMGAEIGQSPDWRNADVPLVTQTTTVKHSA